MDECKAAIEAEDMQALEAASTRWLEWDPESGDAWLFLADASAQQSDFERAAECLDRIDDSHPKCVPALLQRVEILFAKLNRPLDAVATCERILE
ncbi:MAG: tetratricopeptide repeat protein, partial [Planctomycetota bacterium]|nr:tetratricopeptide repeat protein [Planctomycetota bacterium]